jgi:hypothetical protein
MPRVCTCCTHSERAAIDAALLENQTYRRITERFGVSEQAARRHREHITPALAKAQEAREVADADTLLDQVKNLQFEAGTILERAKSSNDLKTALSAISQARACIELLAKLTGELAAQPTVNLIVNPKWIETRTVILQALSGHPDARADVVKALEGIQS